MDADAAALRLPFPVEEYRARRARVCQAMQALGIDLLYVTHPANLQYLTGYEAMWYPDRLPSGAILDGRDGHLVLCDWNRHAGYVGTSVLCDESLLFAYGQAPDAVCAYLARRGWLGRRIALEWNSPHPRGPVLRELAGRLREAGMDVLAGDWVVDDVRLYKSGAELACIRQAAAIADAAMLQLRSEMAPGMTELEVSVRLTQLLVQHGSGLAATPVLVNSGPRAWVDVHAFPSARALVPGDVVSVDCCATVAGYHANLARTFVLGPSQTRARAIIAAAAGSFEELRRHAVLDGDPAPAAAAADRYVRERVAAAQVWWVGGYALGLGAMPSWVGHTYLANDGVRKCVLKAGYVSNFENVFVDEQEGFEAGCIDTVVMTPDGLELLSAIPRELLDIPV